jgi:GrpB-like predicted nucleotidyltransferase (UPF0157 family)
MALARINEYSEAWAIEFQDLAAKLAETLGETALRVDHIGSTSVPGLASKDVIDIQLTVRDLDDEGLATALASLGFRLRPGNQFDHLPPWADADSQAQWAKRYYREPEESRVIHLHVRVAGSSNQRYALLFRDFLRANHLAADAYAEFKRRLSALGIEGGVYAEIKDPVCDLIMLTAETWATDTGWKLA